MLFDDGKDCDILFSLFKFDMESEDETLVQSFKFFWNSRRYDEDADQENLMPL